MCLLLLNVIDIFVQGKLANLLFEIEDLALEGLVLSFKGHELLPGSIYLESWKMTSTTHLRVMFLLLRTTMSFSRNLSLLVMSSIWSCRTFDAAFLSNSYIWFPHRGCLVILWMYVTGGQNKMWHSSNSGLGWRCWEEIWENRSVKLVSQNA